MLLLCFGLSLSSGCSSETALLARFPSGCASERAGNARLFVPMAFEMESNGRIGLETGKEGVRRVRGEEVHGFPDPIACAD